MAVVKLIYQIACVKVLACFPSIMWLLLGTFRYPAKKNFSAYECNMKLVTTAETSHLKLSCALLNFTSSGLIANIIMHKGAHTNSFDNLNQDSSRHARTLRTHSCCSITLTMQWQQWMLAVQWTISHCRMHTGLCREKQNSIEGVGKQMHAIDSKAVQSKQHGKIVQYSGQLGCQLAQRTFELGECQSTTNISSDWWYAIICKCTWASLWT